jgi:polysaccharide chain length determinant protein (PEP-CTERM system associated)
MQELLDQVISFVRGAWRFRWYFHLIAWPICIAGWAFVYKMPDQYEASARVYVDTQSVLRPLLRGLAVQTNIEREVEVMTRTILSRPNLEKIARMTDMDLEAKTPEDMEKLLDRLRRAIHFSSGRSRENLYTITYVDKDPERGKQVVQSLLTLFVETSLGDTRKDTNVAQRFLDDQIKEYESRLIAAEDALKEFKRKNIGLMPQEGQEYFQKLRTTMGQLSSAELEMKEAINRRDELRRQLRGEEPTFGMVTPQATVPTYSNTALDARIQSLQTKLDELLLKYTDKHPDVVAVQNTLASLEKQKEEELAQMQQSAPQTSTQGLESNPVYQQLRISLGEAEATVAGLRVRVDQFRSEVDHLKGAIDTIPQVEAEFKRLNRDYEINKKNYEELVERRESAKLSEQAGQTSDDVKFRIIDPPFVPTSPVAPNRPLLVSVVLLAACGFGMAFAVFLSQVKPSFDSVRTVTRELGVPVFGSVSRVWTGHTRLKRRAEVLAFGAGGLVLMGLYGAYMTYLIMSDKVV